MRRGKTVGIVLVILLVLALVLGGCWYLIQKDREEKAVAAAELAHGAVYDRYTALLEAVHMTSLTVTENGRVIGTYDLAALGLETQLKNAVTSAFGAADQMSPGEFAALSAEQKLAWQAPPEMPAPTLDGEAMDCAAVLLDLNKEIRRPAKDAWAKLENGAYVIVPEEPGTQLDSAAVERALRQTVDGAALGPLTFEVSEYDVYLPAAVTTQSRFDYAPLLERDAAGVRVTVQLLEQTEVLQAADYVTVDDTGVLHAEREKLEALAARWAEQYRAEQSPYILDSFVKGPVPLDFLLCDYELDQSSAVEQLGQALCQMETVTVKAPFFCSRNGEPFAIEGTYVEVDVANQHMAYYVDGEVLVDTDVVTGYPWGHWTPPGLYAVQNIDVDRWLTGEDYRVFVEYWVGFSGAYGIHDASWRTIFGGKKYLSDGSHGCVNTPTEAMKIIHENITVGTPVVVHDVKDD